MKAWVADKAARVAKRLGHDPRLKWMDAQKFELNNAAEFMEKHPGFLQAVARLDRPECYASQGYVDNHVTSEFFAGYADAYRGFIDQIAGKAILDVGPCIFTPISLWDVAASRMIIEPLYDDVVAYQLQTYGRNYFEHIELAFSAGAEKLIPELVGKIDGAILVRNCIDHSPQWPFILANIAAYAAPGCKLLLWNDLMHPPSYMDGHFDITNDAHAFRRLLEALGFRIDYEFELHNTECLDYGCRATRLT